MPYFSTRLAKGGHQDEFTLYEKEPFKMMVLKELRKKSKKIDSDVGMITNLSNIK